MTASPWHRGGMGSTARRAIIYHIAAIAECDVRTAERAYEHGPDVIRGRVVRERIRRTMVDLGIMPVGSDHG